MRSKTRRTGWNASEARFGAWLPQQAREGELWCELSVRNKGRQFWSRSRRAIGKPVTKRRVADSHHKGHRSLTTTSRYLTVSAGEIGKVRSPLDGLAL